MIASNRPDYSVGDIVLAQTAWCTHALSDGAGVRKLDPAAAPVTTALGVLGMPGFTAYSGLRSIGKPKPGETVVVAAASGPVGSLVGQLAKLAGARAIGIAGGPPKCAYVKNELQFDAAIDHRATDFPAQLARACPKGIDVYFENVGGAVWQAVVATKKAEWVEKSGDLPKAAVVSPTCSHSIRNSSHGSPVGFAAARI